MGKNQSLQSSTKGYKKGGKKGGKKGSAQTLASPSTAAKNLTKVAKTITKQALPKKPGKSKGARYDPKSDRTLTKAQQQRETFKSTNFRAASNPTVHKYSSGYHEVLPTDLYKKLETLLNNKATNTTIANKSVTVDMQAVREIVEIADGFRTDTAQTLMSAMDEEVAPHAGSLKKTPRQAEAHNLLREVVRDMIDINSPNADGRTQKSMAVVLGSLAVSSIAPGDQVRKSGLPYTSLKAQPALVKWEAARNDAKSAVDGVFDTLSAKEKAFVKTHMKGYFANIGAKTKSSRTLQPNRSVSPHREIKAKQSISGLGYISQKSDNAKSKLGSAPTDTKKLGYYFTSFFRALRQ